MIYNKVKNFIKLNFPYFAKKLIEFRDTNNFSKKIKDKINLELIKKIHGKKIINGETGVIIDKTKDNFVSYTLRPKNTKGIVVESDFYENEDIAIIIQGSLSGLNNFTEQTIDLYLKLFQKSKIILSIWENEINKFPIKKYEDKIKIIVNTTPLNEIHNVNLQMISTHNALKY